MLFRNAVIAAVILSLTACTTLRAIEDFSPSRIQQQVEVGDEVRIAASDGKVYELTVTQVEVDSLTGRTDSGKRFKIPYISIQHIEVAEMDAVKTVGGTLATAWVVVGALAAYAIAVILEDLGDD